MGRVAALNGFRCGLALAMIALGCGSAAARRPPMRLSANPSAVIAAEIALARQSREEGQWHAFAKVAAPEAMLFTPEATAAKGWLKKQAEPAEAPRWQTERILMSCDGVIGVATGPWQDGATLGYSTTIWQRDEKKGNFRWLLTHHDRLSTARPEPEMIQTKLAECPTSQAAPPAPPTDGKDRKDEPPRRMVTAPSPIQVPVSGQGTSPDRSLIWAWTSTSGRGRDLTVWLWNGESYAVQLHDVVLAAVKEPPTP